MIVLAVMNISLLVFLWFGYKHNQTLITGGNGGGLKVLVEKLSLSEGQRAQLEVLRREHFQRMDPLRRQSHETRAKLHSLWATGGTEAQVDSISNKIGELQAQIERNTFRHFSDIRSFCSPDQKRIFDQIIQDVLKQGDRRPSGPANRNPRRGAQGRPPPGRN